MDNRIRDKMEKEGESPIKKEEKIMKEEKTKKKKTYLGKEESKRRAIIACGNYYYPISDNYGKKIKSCIAAGYSEDHAKKYSSQILGIDRVKDTLAPVWRNLANDLVLCQSMLHNWLNKHQDSAETKDIRELPKFIRLIGDSVGKFVKKEMKIEGKFEEKHIYHHFDSKDELIKHHEEVIDLRKQEIERLTEDKEE